MSTRPVVKPDFKYEVYEFSTLVGKWTRLAGFAAMLDAGTFAINRSRTLHQAQPSGGWEVAVTPDLDVEGNPRGWTSFFPVSGERKRLTHTSEFPVI